MVVVPADMPVTNPPVPMVATPVLLLVQLPPETLSDKVVVEPVQIVVVPVIADAGLPTVTVAVSLVVPHALVSV